MRVPQAPVAVALLLVVLASAACGQESSSKGSGSPSNTLAASLPPSGPSAAPTASGHSSPPPSLVARLGSPGGAGAATRLQAQARCEAAGSRVAVADLSWSLATSRGKEQRVALTKFREGFDTNNFDVSPSLPADASSATWRGLNPGGVHYWRVLTLQGDLWIPSQTETFTGPTCVADYVAPTPSY